MAAATLMAGVADAHDAATGCNRQRRRCWRNSSPLVDASIDTTGRQQGLLGLLAPPLMWRRWTASSPPRTQ